MAYNLVATFVLTGLKVIITFVFALLAVYFLLSDIVVDEFVYIITALLVNPLLYIASFFFMYFPILYFKREEIQNQSVLESLEKYLPIVIVLPAIVVAKILLEEESLSVEAQVIMIDTILLVQIGFYQFIQSYKQLTWQKISNKESEY